MVMSLENIVKSILDEAELSAKKVLKDAEKVTDDILKNAEIPNIVCTQSQNEISNEELLYYNINIILVGDIFNPPADGFFIHRLFFCKKKD